MTVVAWALVALFSAFALLIPITAVWMAFVAWQATQAGEPSLLLWAAAILIGLFAFLVDGWGFLMVRAFRRGFGL
jgi:hypothetical protein